MTMFSLLKIYAAVDKVLDVRATLVFHRLQRFYHTFNIVSTLLGGLALAVLTFDEFRSTDVHGLLDASAGLLTSSTLTAVIAVTIATMLLFKFEGHERPTRKELLIAWIPLVLLDVVIVEFLLAVVFWYAAKYAPWRSVLMGAQLAVLLVGTVAIAVWMWRSMSVKGGLGAEERKVTESSRRVADK
ncbi:hypothetical protein H2200_002173 [Cladophialophora chaetospira]|uniref:Transmembrane protein n=1 Tax=Cladophialophora chaetospira TaxID=386627 RepID=A0AA38XIE4_9EURO|nr:hypothetical protein H2200_002173 [Cladophialophora chaetospira]